MRFSVVLVLLSCVAFLISSPPLSFARTATKAPTAADPSYHSALAAANRFLHAWQTQDHEAGLMMLSDAARQRVSPEKLQEFFSPGPEAAFEIQHGHRIKGGGYAFPVVLFGVSSPMSRPRVCSIVLIRAGKDEWVVDRLP